MVFNVYIFVHYVCVTHLADFVTFITMNLLYNVCLRHYMYVIWPISSVECYCHYYIIPVLPSQIKFDQKKTPSSFL